MTEQDGPQHDNLEPARPEPDRLSLEREAISARVASFKATQERFQREREEYYAAKMAAARNVKWNRFAGGSLHR